MKTTTANALFRYFEELYCLNQNVIALCGTNAFDLLEEQEQVRRIDEAMITIPRLIPYGYNKKYKLYEIRTTDGLMNFSKDIPFLKESYEGIFQIHKDFLIKVIKIRNKLEHEIHNAKISETGSGSFSLFDVTYKIDETEIDIYANEIISFVKDLNVLFSKIQSEVIQYACEHQKTEYRYYMRINRFDFCDFNKIYESNMLCIIGKAMLPF